MCTNVISRSCLSSASHGVQSLADLTLLAKAPIAKRHPLTVDGPTGLTYDRASKNDVSTDINDKFPSNTQVIITSERANC
jgi:hypothetical protein